MQNDCYWNLGGLLLIERLEGMLILRMAFALTIFASHLVNLFSSC
jgi:hypothetical protein